MTPATKAPLYPADLIPLQYQAVMLGDEERMGAFERSIDLMIKPGMKVVDLGCGTGVLSFMAARAGAQVWAVEMLTEMADVTRSLMRENDIDTVEVVEASATEYVTPEPVDAVICEMLHVGMLREKQIEVIREFRTNHLRVHSVEPKIYIPDTTFQAFQFVEHDFNYHGFEAPLPVFQQASAIQTRSIELSHPVLYQRFSYMDQLPTSCEFSGSIPVAKSGTLNAVRMITKSAVAIDEEAEESVDWFMQYLIMPLAEPVRVLAGGNVEIEFSYLPGSELSALSNSLSARAI